MIIDKPKSTGTIVIDLTGPDGNAHYLISIAKSLGAAMQKDHEDIVSRMKSGDYENLLRVFDQEFGEHIVMYR
jgi:hypothetical protein